ncbi:MAG: hypothetical protein ACTSQE_07280 [Candidatus Heimdallarchaeaceae archaeon]
MTITRHKKNGILIEFNNGLKLSTIWGYLNYCENNDNPSSDGLGFGVQKDGSKDVEFMFTAGDSETIKKLCKRFGSDENLSGYVPLEKWLEMLSYIQKIDKPELEHEIEKLNTNIRKYNEGKANELYRVKPTIDNVDNLWWRSNKARDKINEIIDHINKESK